MHFDRMPRKGLFYSLMLSVALMAQGCRSVNPVYDTFTNVLPRSLLVTNLQPGFEYLWVSVYGKASVMALGARETRGNAVHEHWYNGQGEMLHLVDGRVQQALGFAHELRQQTGAPPAWASFQGEMQRTQAQAERQAQATKDVTWKRQLDVMPGYRFGVQETLVSRTLAEPDRLPEGVPANAQWVADEVFGKKANGLPWVYAQRFAVANGRVVYSEQCLAPAVCLKLRPLGVVVP
ncbi:Group 4 capsule polysaccharide formation lipoprotein GfcB [Burkholderiaceae bacterium]